MNRIVWRVSQLYRAVRTELLARADGSPVSYPTSVLVLSNAAVMLCGMV
jgi:hypothetical protein